MMLSDHIEKGRARLAKSPHISDPDFAIRQMALGALHCQAKDLYLRWDRPLSDTEQRDLGDLVDSRLAGIPLQYLTKYAAFYESEFSVGPGVFIPRKETELLVDRLLAEPGENLRVAELGAGSGNIGISVLRKKPGWEWHAFEVSPEAHLFARCNQLQLAAHSHYHLHFGNYLDAVRPLGSFDFSVANPPYLTSEDLSALSPEVLHEPSEALWGGQDGLDVIRNFISVSYQVLKPGGRILLEFGYRQAPAVRTVLLNNGFESVEIIRDLAGLDRAATAQRPV